MELVTPDAGLFFWMIISFSIVLYILKRFAWKPILHALKERESSIENALKAAKNAQSQIDKLKSENQKAIEDAKKEKDAIIKETKKLTEKLLEESRQQATEDAQKILDAAKLAIENEKHQVINEMKEQIALLSIEIAEKILVQKLESDQNQHDLINKYLEGFKIN